MRCKYLVTYTSAVTGRVVWSGCGDKATAEMQACNLRKEGAKGVAVLLYGSK